MKSKKIDKICCGLALDKNTGAEGICAYLSKFGNMPLVSTGNLDINIVRLAAQKIANESGCNVTVCEFSQRKDLQTFKPQRKGKGKH